METKNEKKVSIMKEQIIKTAVECMKKEGLKFSLDMLAEKMKISKKTIYKYFPCKEILAREIYQAYYDGLDKRSVELLASQHLSEEEKSKELLSVYFESVRMNRDDIFNKFNLNDLIRGYASQRQNGIWAAISPQLGKSLNAKETASLRIILDGAFEKTLQGKSGGEEVFSLLGRLI